MGKEKQILVLPGDGIGPELMAEGLKVLGAVGKKYGHKFYFVMAPFGAEAYFKHGSCFPDYTQQCVKSNNYDAVLKGPIGLDDLGTKRLKAAGVTSLEQETVIALRSPAFLDTWACYRPVVLPKEFAFFSPLRPEIIGGGIDILMMRELVGGIYFGPKEEGVSKDGTIGTYARDDCTYTLNQTERFAELCFGEAEKRDGKLTLAHKRNVLAIGRYWEAIFDKTAKKRHPNIPFEKTLIDSFFTKFKLNPTSFNGVVAFNNLDGDYTTDDGGGVIGSLGLMPSACWNPESRKGYFEPSHGSAPDIAGKNKANPYSMIGSVALMLDMAFGMKQESDDVWSSLKKVFSQGHMTGELVRKLTETQRNARADDDLRRLYSAFQDIDQNISKDRVRTLIAAANMRCDSDLEARIVSTTQFGGMVVENLLA